MTENCFFFFGLFPLFSEGGNNNKIKTKQSWNEVEFVESMRTTNVMVRAFYEIIFSSNIYKYQIWLENKVMIDRAGDTHTPRTLDSRTYTNRITSEFDHKI